MTNIDELLLAYRTAVYKRLIAMRRHESAPSGSTRVQIIKSDMAIMINKTRYAATAKVLGMHDTQVQFNLEDAEAGAQREMQRLDSFK